MGSELMNRYVSTGNRDQISILPMCLDDMISEDNVVRAIDAIVERMDIPSLGFKYTQTAQTGRMPYNPEDMFKLYAYSYFNGIRSSRKIEKETHRNIEVMWLINELKPDFKTIADFRKDNKKQIKAAFSKFSIICDELGLIGKEMIAVDGSGLIIAKGPIILRKSLIKFLKTMLNLPKSTYPYLRYVIVRRKQVSLEPSIVMKYEKN
jgi:transposase